MALVKHSTRTLRKPCKFCGAEDLYWAHDTEKTGDRHCDECATNGAFVLVNAHDGNRSLERGTPLPESDRHAHTCTGSKPDGDTPEPSTMPTPGAETDAPAQVTPPPLNPAPANPHTVGSLDSLVWGMVEQAVQAGVAIDATEVERVIAKKLSGMVFPHTTVYAPAPDAEPVTIEGAHSMLPAVLRPLSVGIHVMMVGPAGTGKTHLAESAAHALSLPFRSISCHPAMTPTALVGFIDAGGTYRSTAFREAYESGGVFLFDEIDNSHPSILAAMNAALANGSMEFPDGLVKRHDNFRCVAAANTYGRGADRQYVGRQALDAATLDRFAVRDVDYDEALEHALCLSTGLPAEQVDNVLAVCRKLRKSATEKGMRVIVSIRATVGTCRLLTVGETVDSALEALVYKGMSAADRSKLNAV